MNRRGMGGLDSAQNSNSSLFFGMEVKKRLVELNMTQRELAKKIGVNENYLTDTLRGRRSGKKYQAAIKFVLGISSISCQKGEGNKK
jgi:DNA-binding XRE family transcriptional regulator